jgi:hypothetical protein
VERYAAAVTGLSASDSGKDNHFQVLLVRSANGGQSFSAPVKVGNYYDLPDCATYQGGQDAGVLCVPEKGSAQNSVFRATNYPSGGVSPANPRQVAVTFGSYINRNSDETNGCVPQGFSPGHRRQPVHRGQDARSMQQQDPHQRVRQRRQDLHRHHHGPAEDACGDHGAPAGAHRPVMAVGRLNAQRNPGCLLLRQAIRHRRDQRQHGHEPVDLGHPAQLHGPQDHLILHAAAHPFPDTHGNSTFFGDHSGLTAQSGAHPLWMDTRNLDAFTCPGTAQPGVPPSICAAAEPNGIIANDQEIYTRTLTTP